MGYKDTTSLDPNYLSSDSSQEKTHLLAVIPLSFSLFLSLSLSPSLSLSLSPPSPLLPNRPTPSLSPLPPPPPLLPKSHTSQPTTPTFLFCVGSVFRPVFSECQSLRGCHRVEREDRLCVMILPFFVRDRQVCSCGCGCCGCC